MAPYTFGHIDRHDRHPGHRVLLRLCPGAGRLRQRPEPGRPVLSLRHARAEGHVHGDRHGDALDLLRLGPRAGRFRPRLGAADLLLAGRAGRIHPGRGLHHRRILPGNVAGGRLHVQARRHRLCRRRVVRAARLRRNRAGLLGILQSCGRCRPAHAVRLAGRGCRRRRARCGPDGRGRVWVRRDHGENLCPPGPGAQAILAAGKNPPSLGGRCGGDHRCALRW